MNTPVSFEKAKLLKEKGFDEPCRYVHDTWNNIKDWLEGGEGEHRNSHQNGSLYYSAPTIAEVVMWLHKEKGLWVNVMYMGFELKYTWSIDIITTSGSDWDSYGEEGDICYKSPTEAYEAAIIYTLKNLI